MQSYPGATFAIDACQAVPNLYYEYFMSIFPQDRMRHICLTPFNGKQIPISSPRDTTPSVYNQPTYETKYPFDLNVFGPTIRAPLGYVVHARSVDNGSDASVGFFVCHEDEWDWLRSLLSTNKVQQLLGKDDIGSQIFRFELLNIWAVRFLLKDHLDRGVVSSSTYNVLGKNVAEYLRSKFPIQFLNRGRI